MEPSFSRSRKIGYRNTERIWGSHLPPPYGHEFKVQEMSYFVISVCKNFWCSLMSSPPIVLNRPPPSPTPPPFIKSLRADQTKQTIGDVCFETEIGMQCMCILHTLYSCAKPISVSPIVGFPYSY